MWGFLKQVKGESTSILVQILLMAVVVGRAVMELEVLGLSVHHGQARSVVRVIHYRRMRSGFAPCLAGRSGRSVGRVAVRCRRRVGLASFGDTLRATVYAAGGYGRWFVSLKALEVQRCGRSEVLEVREMLEVIQCALLCMLEAVEGRFCSLEVQRCGGRFLSGRHWRCRKRYAARHCWRLWRVRSVRWRCSGVEGGFCLGGAGDAGSDALRATLYAGGCGG